MLKSPASFARSHQSSPASLSAHTTELGSAMPSTPGAQSAANAWGGRATAAVMMVGMIASDRNPSLMHRHTRRTPRIGRGLDLFFGGGRRLVVYAFPPVVE